MADVAATTPTLAAIGGVAAEGTSNRAGAAWDIGAVTPNQTEVNTTPGYVRTLRVQSSNIRADIATSLVGGNVYNALYNAAQVMEARLAQSLETYQEHPDVQANLQQLQYDLQQWNLALTTMTNINKNLGDALKSIASNFR